MSIWPRTIPGRLSKKSFPVTSPSWNVISNFHLLPGRKPPGVIERIRFVPLPAPRTTWDCLCKVHTASGIESQKMLPPECTHNISTGSVGSRIWMTAKLGRSAMSIALNAVSTYGQSTLDSTEAHISSVVIDGSPRTENHHIGLLKSHELIRDCTELQKTVSNLAWSGSTWEIQD